MRMVTVCALLLTVALLMFIRCSNGISLRGLGLPEDDEDFRPQRLERDYGLARRQARARAEDAFDDYGHLRFGRSDE